MDANAIIRQMVEDGTIAKIAGNIASANYRQDLAQEIAIALLEKPPAKIEAMHSQGYLHFYTVRMAINLYRGHKSPFSQKYRHLEERLQYDQNLHDQADENYDTTVDVLWQSCVAEMDRWHKPGEFPYDKTLLLEHMKTWNMKLLSRETGIPYRSICYSVEKIKERLKRAIELNL